MASPTWVIVTAPAQLSDAVTEPVLGAGTLLAQETVMGAGQVIVGGVLSNTTMICAQVEEFPHSSVAIYTREMSNLLVHVILVILSPPCVTVTKPQLSLTVTPPVNTGGTSLAHCTVTPGGQIMAGGVVSSFVIVCTQELTFPQASVAVQVRS